MRHLMLKSKCDRDISVDSLTPSTIDLARLPPSRACLGEHVARANYQTRIWKMANAAIYEIPKLNQGKDLDGKRVKNHSGVQLTESQPGKACIASIALHICSM